MSNPVPQPDFGLPFVDGAGRLSRWAKAWMQAASKLLDGATTPLATTHALASSAVPQGTEVVAAGGLQHGGALGGNVGVALYVVFDAVAGLPASAGLGDWAYALDGRKNGEGSGSGSGTPCWWDGTAWIAPDTGAAVAA